MMIGDIKVSEPKAGKRRRISFDPYLRHDKMVKSAIWMPVDQVQPQYDDRDPDMIHHFRISARLEEERRANYSPNRGIE